MASRILRKPNSSMHYGSVCNPDSLWGSSKIPTEQGSKRPKGTFSDPQDWMSFVWKAVSTYFHVILWKPKCVDLYAPESSAMFPVSAMFFAKHPSYKALRRLASLFRTFRNMPNSTFSGILGRHCKADVLGGYIRQNKPQQIGDVCTWFTKCCNEIPYQVMSYVICATLCHCVRPCYGNVCCVVPSATVVVCVCVC